MVIGDLEVEERPLAAGYFILDTLRTLFMNGVSPQDEIRLHVGLMGPEKLDELRQAGVDIFTPTADLVPWMGDLYKLMVGVSRGRDYEPEEND